MIFNSRHILAGMMVLGLMSCEQKKESEVASPPSSSADPALFTVGSMTISQSDLDLYLQEHHEGRKDPATQKLALTQLAERAQLAQAAKDDGLEQDPAVRAEVARVLSTRFKEKHLQQEIKAIGSQEIPDQVLKEIYQKNESTFMAPEKRQVAVLWLNPNRNPEREKQYVEKLTTARAWLMNNPAVKDHPEQGFSVLSIDNSDHVASRYKGGVVGWLSAAGGFDAFSNAVAKIAFTLKEEGAVSDVLVRPEGVFLVRFMKSQPSTQRTFESVKSEIKQAEQQRLRALAEKNFKESIAKKHPVTWLQSSTETKP